MIKFRLYVAGDAPNSVQAQSNLDSLCRKYFPGCHQIEVVDVFRDPDRAMRDNIFMTPTLIRAEPLPVQFVIGNLSDTATVLDALRLTAVP